MTDDEVATLIAWEIEVSGGRLALMGATDTQIVRAWLAVLKRLDDAREFPMLSLDTIAMH